MTVAFLCNTLGHIYVSDDTTVNFPTEELFSARMMSLRAHTTRDNKPSNLMAMQRCRARVKNARGNSTDLIVGRKTDQRKICIICKYFKSFCHFEF